MTDDSAASKGFGGRIGGKIARHLVSATLATRAQTTPLHRQVGNQILTDFFAGTGAELRNTMGDIFRTLADHPATDDSVRPLLQFLSRGKGEMASFIGGSLTSSVLSGGIGDIITDLLAPLGHAIIAGQPNGLLSVTDVAAAQVRGISIGLPWDVEAAQNGINSDRYQALVELNYRRPEVGQVLDSLNRGDLSEDAARGALLQLGFREGDLDVVIAGRRLLLTPAALADMVVRGIMPEGDAADVAARSGLRVEDFHALVLDTGEPPGIQDLLFLHRRGFIDDARLEHGIRQSRVRDEWIPDVRALSLQPMSTSDAIEAAVQGHLSLDASRAITAQNGLLPEHWQPLYDTAGNPPGVQEMVSMWHRGVLTLDELIQGIKESRLKNKYIQKVIDAGETLLPERSIVSLVSKGGLTDAQGMDLLLRRGYAPDIAQALLAEAHVTKTQTQRELTVSQLMALYEAGALTVDETTSMLASLGYDPEVAAWEITLADLRRVVTFTNAAVSKVHSQYVGWKIDENAATTTLDSLHVPPGQRDNLIVLWNLERSIATKELTLAQITTAHKKQVIDDQEFYDRVRGIGYAPDDAAILVEIAGVDVTTIQGG